MIADFVGKVNSTYFEGAGPGAVLFSGFSGTTMWDIDNESRETGNDSKCKYWQVTMSFQYRPNTTLMVANTLIYKPGWDYLWIDRELIHADETTINVPKGIYVEQVYLREDWPGLIRAAGLTEE